MNRNERFSNEYREKIKAFVKMNMPYIMTKYKEICVETYELSKNAIINLYIMHICDKHNVTLIIILIILSLFYRSNV